MATDRKDIKKYVFTVEGETEQWYFSWLQDIINAQDDALYKVSIVAKVQQSPRKYAKTVNPLAMPSITHICDYESNDQDHIIKFQRILTELKDANSTKCRQFKYSLGYSNFTFDLWMILHKQSCNGHQTSRTQYLRYINSGFRESFESLNHYKQEANFKRCLAKLSIEDVYDAVRRAKDIMNSKIRNGEMPEQYKGFSYYTENPALTIWESIEKILIECGLM